MILSTNPSNTCAVVHQMLTNTLFFRMEWNGVDIDINIGKGHLNIFLQIREDMLNAFVTLNGRFWSVYYLN